MLIHPAMLDPLTLEKLINYHKTSINGLSESEVENRLIKFGPNLIDGKKKTPLIISFLGEFKDLMVIILIIAVILAIISGELIDASVILFIVILNACIGFIQKFKAEKAIEALQKLIAPKARVIRDSVHQQIDAKNLVPGDILILNEGDSITADAILFEVNELEAEESALTGESVPVQKQTKDSANSNEIEKSNLVFMGTIITKGSGKAIVTATGMKTQMGKIAKLTTETIKDLSPLQKELMDIGLFVGKIALGISGLLLVIGIIQGHEFITTLLFATSVAVAAVPEGLPATVTIALAIGVQRLAKKNAIVKQLSSVETLGSTTVICSDKTGTLTKNQMTVKELFLDGYHSTVEGVGYEPVGKLNIKKDHPEGKKLFISGSSLRTLSIISTLCNNAALIKDQNNNWKILGDPTEGALLTLVEKIGYNHENLKKEFEKIQEIPFDSTRKRMTVIVKDLKTGKYMALTKGAPDSIVEITNINSKLKKEVLQQNGQMALRALRCLGFAYKEIAAKTVETYYQQSDHEKKIIESEMNFIGLVGMIDPPRPEVKQAVITAHNAGIRTFIITGDHGLTAEAIAKQLGIITDERKHLVYTGQDLNQFSDHELKKELSNKNQDIIFARVSPEHKLKIVQLLKDLKEIVAVTGDGVNDAPALKRADIGIAMGIAGTDVSKEASNMVLADDSYSTIINAVEEGRTIYDNLKKFVFYIFSSNIGELLTIFLALLLGVPAPLTAILILAVNLGTDVLPAVALGIEPTEKGIMTKKPRSSTARIMNQSFIRRFMLIGFAIGAIVMTVYILTLYRYGWQWGQALTEHDPGYLKASTTAFTLLIMIQIFNAINSRSEQNSIFKLNPFSNWYLIGAIFISTLISIAFVEIGFFQKYLQTTHLNFTDWAIIFLGASLILIIEEIRKFFSRRLIKIHD